MTPRLRAVPPVTDDLEEAALEWCDNARGLARTLGRSLSRDELRQVALTEARASLKLTERLIEVLEVGQGAGI
jgi:hypothetical protein